MFIIAIITGVVILVLSIFSERMLRGLSQSDTATDTSKAKGRTMNQWEAVGFVVFLGLTLWWLSTNSLRTTASGVAIGIAAAGVIVFSVTWFEAIARTKQKEPPATFLPATWTLLGFRTLLALAGALVGFVVHLILAKM